MDDTYRALLGWVVQHKLIVGLLAIGSLVGMGQIAKIMGNDFVNPEDRGQMMVEIEFPAGTSLDESTARTKVAEAELLKDPNYVTVFSTLGADGDVNKVRWRVVAV
jgi:hypothetical protein